MKENKKNIDELCNPLIKLMEDYLSKIENNKQSDSVDSDNILDQAKQVLKDLEENMDEETVKQYKQTQKKKKEKMEEYFNKQYDRMRKLANEVYRKKNK